MNARLATADGRFARYTLSSVDDADGGTLVLEIVDKADGKITRIADTSLRYLQRHVEAGVEFAQDNEQRPFDLLVPQQAPPPPPFPDGATAAQKLQMAAEYYVGRLKSDGVPGTSNGIYACAWAVNFIVRVVLGHIIGDDDLSTAGMYEALVNGAGAAVDPGEPGCIVISPTITRANHVVHGHVGILGADERIYSNSSTLTVWSQNYTVTTWRDHYVTGNGLRLEYFRVG